MNGYSIFPRSPELEPCHQMVFVSNQGQLLGGEEGLTPLQRCSLCILQPHSTVLCCLGHDITGDYICLCYLLSFA